MNKAIFSPATVMVFSHTPRNKIRSLKTPNTPHAREARAKGSVFTVGGTVDQFSWHPRNHADTDKIRSGRLACDHFGNRRVRPNQDKNA
jgi:hypothetical protein